MKNIFIITLLFCLSFINSFAQTYEEMVNRSIDYVEMNDYAAAEQALKAALRKEPANPNNTMLMVNLGTIQRNLGKFDEALLSYNIAVEKFPESSFVRHNRAALYCEMNRFSDALKDYNTILLSDPKDTEAIYRRALIYMSEKNLMSAEEDFEKILEIKPKDLSAQMGLASILKRRSQWKEAEEMYSDLIYGNKTTGELYSHRAECYLRLNRLARAREDIAKALELGYEDPSIYMIRGQLRLVQYEKKMAKADFLKAKEMGVEESIVEEFLRLCK